MCFPLRGVGYCLLQATLGRLGSRCWRGQMGCKRCLVFLLLYLCFQKHLYVVCTSYNSAVKFILVQATTPFEPDVAVAVISIFTHPEAVALKLVAEEL